MDDITATRDAQTADCALKRSGGVQLDTARRARLLVGERPTWFVVVLAGAFGVEQSSTLSMGRPGTR